MVNWISKVADSILPSFHLFFFFEFGCSAFGNLVPNNILAWALILSRCAVLTIGKPGNLQYFSAYRLFRMIALNLSRGVYISSVGCACYFLCTLPNNVCQKKKKKRSPSFYLYMYLWKVVDLQYYISFSYATSWFKFL